MRERERPPSDTENGCNDDPVCQNCGSCWPTDVGKTCPACGASLNGGMLRRDNDDDGGGLKDYVVTMTRLKTVRQTAKVRVKAHSEDEAKDLAEDQAEDKSDSWFWSDEACSEDLEDVEAEDVEVAP